MPSLYSCYQWPDLCPTLRHPCAAQPGPQHSASMRSRRATVAAIGGSRASIMQTSTETRTHLDLHLSTARLLQYSRTHTPTLSWRQHFVFLEHMSSQMGRSGGRTPQHILQAVGVGLTRAMITHITLHVYAPASLITLPPGMVMVFSPPPRWTCGGCGWA